MVTVITHNFHETKHWFWWLWQGTVDVVIHWAGLGCHGTRSTCKCAYCNSSSSKVLCDSLLIHVFWFAFIICFVLFWFFSDEFLFGDISSYNFLTNGNVEVAGIDDRSDLKDTLVSQGTWYSSYNSSCNFYVINQKVLKFFSISINGRGIIKKAVFTVSCSIGTAFFVNLQPIVF